MENIISKVYTIYYFSHNPSSDGETKTDISDEIQKHTKTKISIHRVFHK